MSLELLKTLFGGSSSSSSVETLSASSAVQFHGDGDTIFVDVRGLGEIQMTGTIAGAVRAPLPDFARHAKADGTGCLPAAGDNKRILLVCASGARSGAAAQQLASMGYTQVGNIRGGIGAWKQASGPMEK